MFLPSCPAGGDALQDMKNTFLLRWNGYQVHPVAAIQVTFRPRKGCKPTNYQYSHQDGGYSPHVNAAGRLTTSAAQP